MQSTKSANNLTRYAWLSIGAAILTITLKLGAYWLTNSVGLLSDALESLVNLAGEVIGVHTTALHLSSALGVPTTMLTHKGSGWRYAQPELFWYPPTTQMHRKRSGDHYPDYGLLVSH